MTEYINKTTAYEILEKMEEEHNLSFSKEAYHKAAIVISAMPTEDVQPVVHAHWIKTEHKGYKCSMCNCLSSLFDENLKSVFCPWCGAKMDNDTERYIRDIFMTR